MSGMFRPKIEQSTPAPPAPNITPETPQRQLGGEETGSSTRRNRGRSALRIDLKTPRNATPGAAGVNIPRG